MCGQRATNRIVPLWQVTNEVLEDLFDLDLRILRTLPTFLFRPGRLTKEYIQGRRRRYIRPLRLYLFSSFLLFTVLALTNLNWASVSLNPFPQEIQANVKASRAEIGTLRADLARESSSTDTSSPPSAPAPAESLGDSIPTSPLRIEDVGANNWDEIRRADEALAAVEAILGSGVNVQPGTGASGKSDTDQIAPPPSLTTLQKLGRLLDDPESFVKGMIDQAPYLMFLLVPTFALLLKLLYIRHHRLYVEHLIFALHVHALAFIAFATSTVFGAWNVGATFNLDWWLATSPFVYLFLAMRSVYGQSTLRTVGKALTLLLTYGIILAVAVVFLILITFAFL